MSKPPGRTRPGDPRQAAEAAFKAVTAKPLAAPPPRPSMPNAKEMISLRIDRDVLDFFQDDGPGWQDRINEFFAKLLVSKAVPIPPQAIRQGRMIR